MNQRAEERFLKAVEVDLYVFDCENEFQVREEKFALHVCTKTFFKALSDEPRRTLHNHHIPSNDKYDDIIITDTDIIPQRLHLLYPYSFITADEVHVKLGHMATARMYSWDAREMDPSGFQYSEDIGHTANSGQQDLGKPTGKGGKFENSSKSCRESNSGKSETSWGNSGTVEGGKAGGESEDGNTSEDSDTNGDGVNKNIVVVNEDMYAGGCRSSPEALPQLVPYQHRRHPLSFRARHV